MKQFISKLILFLAGPLVLISYNAVAYALPVSNPTVVFAAADPTCGNGTMTPKGQVLIGIGNTGTDCTGSGVSTIIADVVLLLTYVVGIVSVIVIMVSGFRYITSGGEGNKVAAAKSSLMYAIIGLLIAAVANFLVSAIFHEALKIG